MVNNTQKNPSNNLIKSTEEVEDQGGSISNKSKLVKINNLYEEDSFVESVEENESPSSLKSPSKTSINNNQLSKNSSTIRSVKFVKDT